MKGASPLWVLGLCAGMDLGSSTYARKAIHWLTLALAALALSIVVSCPCPRGVLWLSSLVTKNYFPEIYGFGLTLSICSPNLGRIGEKSIRKLVSCQVGVRLEA